MTKANSLDPPKMAAWLMEQFSPILKNAPLAGDLMEAFKQGRSSAWYWRQVFWAVLIGLLNLFRKRWGRLAYAVVCSGLIATAWFFMFPGGVTVRETVIIDGEARVHSYGPVQEVGRSSALPAVLALYEKSNGIQWPWSLVCQIAFLTAFQTVIAASAIVAYLAFFRLLQPAKLLRALIVTVGVLASSNLALTFLRVTPSVVSDASLVAWCVLVSTPAIFALLLGMWQANVGDDTSRPISA